MACAMLWIPDYRGDAGWQCIEQDFWFGDTHLTY
jgi:hypothetical protein